MMKMKKILIKCILMALISTGCSQVYSWNVKTVEHDDTEAESGTDFADKLRIESALNNELQRDLLKISGKANDNYDNDNNVYNEETLNKFKYDVQNDKDSLAAASVKENPEEKFSINDKSDNQMLNKGNTRSSTENSYNYDDNGETADDPDKNFQKFCYDYKKNKANKEDTLQHELLHRKESVELGNKESSKENNNVEFFNNDRIFKDNKYQLFNKYKTVQATADDIDKGPSNNHHQNINIRNENRKHYYDFRLHNYNKDRKYQYEYSSNDKQATEEHARDDEKYTDTDNYQRIRHCPVKVPDIENFLGSNLFGNTPKKCFTAEDMQLLIMRKDFETLIPKDLPQCLLNDRMITVLINYFKVCQQVITAMTTTNLNELSLKAFFDTLGGYLNFYLVPVAKYSYYAGLASLETVECVLRLHEQCKNMLNTNGNGWKAPMQNVLNELEPVHIKPLHIEEENTSKEKSSNNQSSCMDLDMDREHNETEDSELIISLPKLESKDDSDHLGNVWLPFRRKRIFDLRSQGSAYVLVNFYTTLSECFQYENIKQECYNRKFKQWLLQNIQNHLSDDIFYPGLGAVLRIFETLGRTKQKFKYNDYLWEADYEDGNSEQDDDHETRTKKSYLTSGEGNSNEYFEILQKSKQNQETPKNWLTQYYDNSNEDDKVLKKQRKYNNRENNRDKAMAREYFKAALEYPGKQQQQFRDAQHNLAASIKEQHSRDLKEKPKLRFLELSPPQIIVIIVPVLALIIVIVICCLKLKKKKKKQVKLRESGGGKRRSKKGEEMQLLSAHSKSVVHGSTGSSSSLLSCQLPVKCFAIKRSGPATIETTSLDYSSSEGEEKNIKKPFTKTVKIDEKSKKVSARNDKAAAKVKDKMAKEIPKSKIKSSWETTYSTK